MKKTVYLFICITLFSCDLLFGQDPYFSQYFMSPMTINPALTGKGISDIRLSANRKTQWWGGNIAAFTVSTVAIEKKLSTSKNGNNQLYGSLMFLTDQSNNRLLKNNFIALGTSYSVALDKKADSKLSVGLNTTYSNRMLNSAQFQFQSQFGSLGFLRTIPSNDPVNILQRNHINVDGGVHYSFENDKWGMHSGVGIFHANRPNQSAYDNGKYSLDSRLSLQFSMFKKYTGGSELHFLSSYQKQGLNNVSTLGTLYRLKIPGTHPVNKINLGLFKRFNDSFYPMFGLEGQTWTSALTYDIITSDLKSYYNSVQSVEVSFAWMLSSKKKTKPTVSDRHVLY